MRACILQHVPFEGPAYIGRWLLEHDVSRGTVRLYRDEELPSPEDFDLLVVLGGPMSVNDVERYPWLRRETALIAQAIEAGRGVLGVCLGAQLIAPALGARVGPGPEREIGWFVVRRDRKSDPENAFGLPDEFPALHWHGEACQLPAGCGRLASTEVCRNQVYCKGQNVLAIQCHLEFRPESVSSLADNCTGDLSPGRWVQDEARMLADETLLDSANRLMGSILDRLIGALTPEQA
jgi:GMP synthase-like glutamine amidotransferase